MVSEPTTRLTVRLPERVHRALRAEAARQRISLNRAIVAALSKALREVEVGEAFDRLAQERELYRKALAGMLVEIDPQRFLSGLGIRSEPIDADILLPSLPKLDPPLSQTIIEEREDRF